MIFPPSGSNSSKPPTWHIAGGSIHGGTPRWMIWGYPPWLRKPPSKWGSSITGGITHLNGMHPPSTVSKKGRTNQAFHRELADVCYWRIHTTVFFLLSIDSLPIAFLFLLFQSYINLGYQSSDGLQTHETSPFSRHLPSYGHVVPSPTYYNLLVLGNLREWSTGWLSIRIPATPSNPSIPLRLAPVRQFKKNKGKNWWPMPRSWC